MEIIEFAPAWEELGSERPKFSGVAYSGGIIPGFGIHGDSVIDLSGFDESKIMVLGAHGTKLQDIVGTGRVWKDDEGKLRAEGTISSATESGKIVAALLSEGINVPLSVGINAEVETGRSGRKVVVNNQELRAKTIFRSPRVREVSFVPMGADPHASAARLAAMEAVMANQDELELQVNDLKAKLAAAEERAVAAESRATELEKHLTNIRMAARKQAVEDLHVKLNKTCTETALAMFQGLTDEQFNLVRDAMLSLKPAEAPSQAAPAPVQQHVMADPLQAAAAQQQKPETASLGNIFELAYKRGAM